MNQSNEDNLSKEWPKPSQFKRSIRLEFSIYASAILLLVMAVTGYVITNQYVDTVTQNVIDKLLVQTRSYSNPAGKHILSTEEPDALLLNNICGKLAHDNPDLFWAGIAGTDGVFLAHTDLKKVISSNRITMVDSSLSNPSLLSGEQLSLVGDTICVIVPIEENGIRVGMLGVTSSTDQIHAARRASINSVVSITVLILLVGVPLTMVMVRRKLRPITTITDKLKEVDFANLELDVTVKDRNEFGYLAETLRVMGDKLNLAQRDIVEKERVARELEIAREIQKNILPRTYPKTASFEFSGAYRSAREVGGDYYDFIDLDDYHLGFLVADVSGKSLPGMLVMLLTRDIVIRLARSMHRPADLLSAVNQELSTSIKKGMFVTMFYGVLGKQTGLFTYASAGHNPLVHLNQQTGEAELIKTKGYPLGMMPDDQFRKRIETQQIRLSEDDWLIQYTDGINEAQNAEGEEFGMKRFMQVLKSRSSGQPEDLSTETLNELEAFVGSAPQYDDITLLTLKWSGQAAKSETGIKGEAISAG